MDNSCMWFPFKEEDGTYTLRGDNNKPSKSREIKGLTKLDLLRIWSVLGTFADIHSREYNEHRGKIIYEK